MMKPRSRRHRHAARALRRSGQTIHRQKRRQPDRRRVAKLSQGASHRLQTPEIHRVSHRTAQVQRG